MNRDPPHGLGLSIISDEKLNSLSRICLYFQLVSSFALQSYIVQGFFCRFVVVAKLGPY